MPSIRAGGQLWRYLLLNEEPPSAAALRTQIHDTMPDWEPPACAAGSVGGEELVDGWHDSRQRNPHAGPGPSCSKTGCKNCGDYGPGPKQNCSACLPPKSTLTPRVMTDDGVEATTPRYSVAFVLTDDQDLTLGSLEYMPKTRRLLGSEGITFTNMFATTPVCCP